MRLLPLFPAGILSVIALSLTVSSQEKNKPEPPKDVPKPFFPTTQVVPPGKKTRVMIRGQKLDTVIEAKLSEAKIPVKLLGKGRKSAPPNNFPPDKFGDTEVDVELDVPKDIPTASVELTLVGPGGPGSPLKLLVDQPGIAEKEPNNGFDQAQEIPVPAKLDGRIERNQDVDVFRITGKAGEKIHIEVQAASLGSPADLALTVYDADRRVLDSCDDVDGQPDPVLTVTLPRDGVYFLSLSESHDLGNGWFGYRLLVTKPK